MLRVARWLQTRLGVHVPVSGGSSTGVRVWSALIQGQHLLGFDPSLMKE